MLFSKNSFRNSLFKSKLPFPANTKNNSRFFSVQSTRSTFNNGTNSFNNFLKKPYQTFLFKSFSPFSTNNSIFRNSFNFNDSSSWNSFHNDNQKSHFHSSDGQYKRFYYNFNFEPSYRNTNYHRNPFFGQPVRNFSTSNEPNEPPKVNWLWVVFLTSAIITGYLTYSDFFEEDGREIDWHTFKESYLVTGEVEKLIVSTKAKRVFVKTRDRSRDAYFLVPDVAAFEKQLEETQKELGIQVFDFVPVIYNNHDDSIRSSLRFIQNLMFWGSILATIYFLRRNVSSMGGSQGIFSFGKGKHKRFNKEMNINISFKDVAGMDEAKFEIMEFVDFLKTPSRYTKLGAKIPKGAILIGPPGTGKTLLAKATAGEAGVPFFSVSGSDFIEMFVGVGPSRVRDMFSDARANSPCIIFIDEIDAVGRARGKGGWTNDERENTLNQLLVEMDGFQSETGVVVLAGTNRPDILDPALLRPGRFDRQIYIENPDIKGRKAIFEIYLKKLKLADPVEDCAKRLASLTPGFSGADIANVCNEGALIAARHNKTNVTLKDLEAAIDRVIGGLERKNRVLSPQEKMIVAYHEAGHAVAGWFLEYSSPLLKVSIIPRGVAALGFAQYQPKDNVIYTKDELLDRMCMTLGGRIAEELIFGKISTGASDDLDKVTKLAYAQITKWGMNNKVGNVSFPDPSEEEFAIQKPFSEATGRLIDLEVRNLVHEAYVRTETLLKERKEELIKLAKRLLEKEVLVKDDLVELLGSRPFKEQTTYEELINEPPNPSPSK